MLLLLFKGTSPKIDLSQAQICTVFCIALVRNKREIVDLETAARISS